MTDLHNPPDYLDLDTSDSFPWARPVAKRLLPPQRMYDVAALLDRLISEHLETKQAAQ